MTLLGKLVTSLIVAAVASTITTKLMGGQLSDLTLHIAFAAATIATALLTSLTRSTAVASSSSASSNSSSSSRSSASPARTESSGDADREEGEVKWFNVSKGFGFITKDDGEEIFVHFRSIRGDGRRSLKDGQRVSFHVADSDKGPQAEDVEGH